MCNVGKGKSADGNRNVTMKKAKENIIENILNK